MQRALSEQRDRPSSEWCDRGRPNSLPVEVRDDRQADHDSWPEISKLWSSKLAVEFAHTRLAAVNCWTDTAPTG
jgi:hypothetical protein